MDSAERDIGGGGWRCLHTEICQNAVHLLLMFLQTANSTDTGIISHTFVCLKPSEDSAYGRF